jgi:hypothetical protein
MPELTPEPDSTGGENQKNKLNQLIFLFLKIKQIIFNQNNLY